MTFGKDLIQAIHALLKEDVKNSDALLLVLEREKALLAKRDFSELAALSDEKQQLIELFDKNNKQRVKLLGPYIDTQGERAQFQQFLTQCPPAETKALQATNSQLEEKLGLCKSLNAVNGQAIAISLKNNQELLDILQGKSATPSLYTATGGMSGGGGGHGHHEV